DMDNRNVQSKVATARLRGATASGSLPRQAPGCRKSTTRSRPNASTAVTCRSFHGTLPSALHPTAKGSPVARTTSDIKRLKTEPFRTTLLGEEPYFLRS